MSANVVDLSDRFGASYRRLRLVPATADVLLELMKHGTSGRPLDVIEHALPEDATIYDLRVDMKVWGMIYVVVESATFEAVADGEPIPMHPTPVFRAREPQS